MNVDLHTHSYFSDGEYSPEDIILEAKKHNISALSITDHNVIGYDENIKSVAKIHHIKFIDGIEISTLYRSPNGAMSLHVLGFGKNFDRILIHQGLIETINGYNGRARKIINKLNQEFPAIKLDFEKIKNENREAYISRNTLARLLTGHVKNLSIKDALKKYVFAEEDDAWMMRTEDSFRLIKQAGGVPVLAHSGRELRRVGLAIYENMIRQFAQLGLRGLEVYYPKHTAEETHVMKDIAKKYGLSMTGGSDWHGPTYTPNITMGISDDKMDSVHFLKILSEAVL